MPTANNFELVETEVGPIENGQALIRNLFMSVDPYMRGRMNDVKSYTPPFEIGRAMSGGAVGEVVESRAEGIKPGDVVLSMNGWRESFVADSKGLQRVDPSVRPVSIYLGLLGMPGMTAWVGLNLVDVKDGDVVFISGAAGAVGSAAGQLAKLRGCQVIGSAGSNEKVSFLLDECGYDAAFNYKTGPVLDQLKQAAPDGIDVYFDNVGGDTLTAALYALRQNGRIIACGSISGYNAEAPRPGPPNLFYFITKRLTMRGMIVSDWFHQQGDFLKEVGGYYRAGKLKSRETVFHGIEQAPAAFLGLFDGSNTGKMIVDLRAKGE